MESTVKEHFGCPVQATSNILAGKWKVLIVWQLSFAPRRFAEIRDILPGVTEKMLAAQLRQLEADGIVSRTVSADVPPRVEYRLTPAGKEMIPVMEVMCGWGIKHLGIDPQWPRPKPSEAPAQAGPG
jgi:DNA-binding HxlR family transcriptional regulator